MKSLVAIVVATGIASAQPKPGSTVELTWVVSPAIPNPKHPKDGPPLHPLTLMVGTQRIVLKPQLGALYAHHQSVCATVAKAAGYGQLGPDEVAKITFAEGGEGGYLVRKTKAGFELVAWEQAHALCKDPRTGRLDGCPPTRKLVRRLNLPPNAKLVEKLVHADRVGKRTPFDCTADP